MTIEQFYQLPRNPAYKYEYDGREAVLSPRPLGFDIILGLAERPDAGLLPESALRAWGDKLRLRQLGDEDWTKLPGLLAGAFSDVPPFASLSGEERKEAAADCLCETRAGAHGAVLP